MSADKNSSKKEMKFCEIFENPQKKSCFFRKAHSISKLFRIASNHFQKFLNVSLEKFDFTLSDFETLNATI